MSALNVIEPDFWFDAWINRRWRKTPATLFWKTQKKHILTPQPGERAKNQKSALSRWGRACRLQRGWAGWWRLTRYLTLVRVLGGGSRTETGETKGNLNFSSRFKHSTTCGHQHRPTITWKQPTACRAIVNYHIHKERKNAVERKKKKKLRKITC